jgi:hypothetical protein
MAKAKVNLEGLSYSYLRDYIERLQLEKIEKLAGGACGRACGPGGQKKSN